MGAPVSLLLPHPGPGLVAGGVPCLFLLPLPDLLQHHWHLAEAAHGLSDSERLTIWDRQWRRGERKEMENKKKKAKIQEMEISCRKDISKGRRKERKKKLFGSSTKAHTSLAAII